MKYTIPEISWHNRDPVLSIDFQPKKGSLNESLRLASGGTDSHVLIWHVNTTETGQVNFEVAADLNRHQKAVNVVRWSPNGQLLASGDDEAIIFVWKQNTEKESANQTDQNDEVYKETWTIFKTLRGHMEDVLDISWSPNSQHLASGSVDNKLIIWDVNRGKYTSILTDHKGFVQGVAWDPKGQMIASSSSDRVFRTFDVQSKKVISRSGKASLPFPKDHPFHNVNVRLYHDDTLQTFYRRLNFSPDGLLIAVPAGKIEPEQGKMDIKPINAIYIYTRYSLKVPACIIPCDSPALAVRWSPVQYSARDTGPNAAFPLRRRQILAVATKNSVLIYDTQQKSPIALLSNIHYTRLTDLSWSPDGLALAASSTDGFCSLVTFREGELGEPLPDNEEPEPMEVTAEENEKETSVDQKTPKQIAIKRKSDVQEKSESKNPEENKAQAKPIAIKRKPGNNLSPKEAKPIAIRRKGDPKPQDETTKSSNIKHIDPFIKFKSPNAKSKNENMDKTPVKIDVLEEVAMSSWSDNSNNEIIKPKQNAPVATIEIEDSEDIKLVYEETEGNKSMESPSGSPKESTGETNSKEKSPPEKSSFFKHAKVTDVPKPAADKVIPSPKAPRRVNFVTLSSPKNSKKKLNSK